MFHNPALTRKRYAVSTELLQDIDILLSPFVYDAEKSVAASLHSLSIYYSNLHGEKVEVDRVKRE